MPHDAHRDGVLAHFGSDVAIHPDAQFLQHQQPCTDREVKRSRGREVERLRGQIEVLQPVGPVRAAPQEAEHVRLAAHEAVPRVLVNGQVGGARTHKEPSVPRSYRQQLLLPHMSTSRPPQQMTSTIGVNLHPLTSYSGSVSAGLGDVSSPPPMATGSGVVATGRLRLLLMLRLRLSVRLLLLHRPIRQHRGIYSNSTACPHIGVRVRQPGGKEICNNVDK
ncbi:hypothetical protein EYF80_004757 [Liparis tanakae]|uniref:Uncharacterized protein n=1 Tax=Liparis tanakae TaxID=230148 RepID=A0A4Z2J6C7_9TELE|nr:hypothetical protein EYF80_004757 [Liparis tanakae]